MDKSTTKSLYKRIFVIDETVGLHENCSFWLAILLPVAFCLFLMVCFYYQLYQKGGGSFNFTQPGIAVFIEYFSFPISLLSLSIVFGVMVARFHSSKQRAVSNDAALRNNAVNYFYKTHEEFEKYCNKLIQSKHCSIEGVRSDICYSILFESSRPESPNLFVNDNFFKAIEKVYSVYIDNFIKYLNSEKYHAVLKENCGRGHSFNFDNPLKLQDTIGISLAKYGHVHHIYEIEYRLSDIFNSVSELFSFPGLENHPESTENLNKIYTKWDSFLKHHPKYLDLQTPQD